MATTRKPKRAFVQFLIAAAAAIVVGVAAVGVTFAIVQSVLTVSNQERESALIEKNRIAQENARLKEELKTAPATIRAKRLEVRAMADIPLGAPITKDLVSAVEVEDAMATDGAFKSVADVIGKRAAKSILAGEILTLNKISTSDNEIYSVPEGYRAMTIALDGTGSLDGSLMPGVYVDVISTLKAKDEIIAKTLIQRVKVIGVQQKNNGNNGNNGGAMSNNGGMNNGIQNITLAVTPGQAELLALASNEGRFHLTLRNFKDNAQSSLRGTDIAQLVSGRSRGADVFQNLPALPLPPSPRSSADVLVSDPGTLAKGDLPAVNGAGQSGRKFTMEVFKGASSETTTFEMDKGS
jgi:pilus assembly protein CpaB